MVRCVEEKKVGWDCLVLLYALHNDVVVGCDGVL